MINTSIRMKTIKMRIFPQPTSTALPRLKYALSGAPCANKTTTLYTLLSRFKRVGARNVTLSEETARRCPYPINTSGSFKAQLWMLTEMIRNEVDLQDKWDIVICDRSVFDVLPFYDEMIDRADIRPLTELEYAFLNDTACKWAKLAPYTKIFWSRPFPLSVDPDRQISESWQLKIDDYFAKTFAVMPNVVEVNGSHDERIEFITEQIVKSIIENHGNAILKTETFKNMPKW